jgi:hypothetical protein
MPPHAIAAQLRKVAAAAAANDRDLAAARLAWLPGYVLDSLGTRLDSSTLLTLNAWQLL